MFREEKQWINKYTIKRVEVKRTRDNNLANDLHKIGGVGKIAIVEEELYGALCMAIAINVFDAICIKRRRTPDNSMHLIAFL